jgi:predicted secreted protein
MTLTSALATYLIIWWLILFMVLPFGAGAKIKAADIEDGQDAGAPAKPMMFKKLLATTLISAVVFALFYFAFESGAIDLRQPE